MKHNLFCTAISCLLASFFAVFTTGCVSSGFGSGAPKLQVGEEISTVISPGIYIFDTERVSRHHTGPVFYESGEVRVANESSGIIRVTLLDGRGGDFAFQNNDGNLTIVDPHIGYGNVEYDLSGNGLLLQGNMARGTCKAKLKNAGRRDYREGTWTLRPR